MVRKIQVVQEEINDLENKVVEIYHQLSNLYGQYIELLSESVQKQLVLAAYQISTQKYPEEFLKLSFSQREKLQKKIRAISKEITRDSLNLEAQNAIPKEIAEQMIKAMLDKMPVEPQENENQEGKIVKQSINIEQIGEQDNKPIKNPEILFNWQQHLEIQIRELLDQLSNKANQILQQNNILPSKLPSKLLEMAIKAEAKGAPMTGPPNLLNVLIEAKNNDKPEDSANITPVTAIHLRLSEIEFADPNLSNQRHQIRNVLASLATIRQKYKKAQRELAIAEAEAAWRSSWYEE